MTRRCTTCLHYGGHVADEPCSGCAAYSLWLPGVEQAVPEPARFDPGKQTPDTGRRRAYDLVTMDGPTR